MGVWASVGVWAEEWESEVHGQRQLREFQNLVEALDVRVEAVDKGHQFERIDGLEKRELLLDLAVDRFDVRAVRVREHLGFASLTPKQ